MASAGSTPRSSARSATVIRALEALALICCAACEDTATLGDAGIEEAGAAQSLDANRVEEDSGITPRDYPPAVKECRVPCETTADCPIGLAACVDSICERYTFCRSNADCAGDVCVLLPPSTQRTCARPCRVARDCSIEDQGPYRTENFGCTLGYCQYLGCTRPEDCDPGTACAPAPSGENYAGYGDGAVNRCARTCGAPSDCIDDTLPAHSEHNFECDDGLCRWLGCSDADCPGACR